MTADIFNLMTKPLQPPPQKPATKATKVRPPRKYPLADDLKKTNLFLVGMMGAGKTTIGRKLANRLGYRFLDTDALIEQSTGKPVTDLFVEVGEAGFREIETQVLAQVSAHTCLVVATGGGIVTQPVNWSHLHHGIVVWLDVPVPVLVSRLSGDSTRPLLQGTDLSQKLTDLLEARQDRYAQADIRIEYEGRSLGKTCDRILHKLQERLHKDLRDRDAAVANIEINQTDINPVVECLE